MSTYVLDLPIIIKYGDSEAYPCQIKVGFNIECLGPNSLSASENYFISLQFFPRGSFIDQNRSIKVVDWPIF
jgi:hypothetical protein